MTRRPTRRQTLSERIDKAHDEGFASGMRAIVEPIRARLLTALYQYEIGLVSDMMTLEDILRLLRDTEAGAYDD